MNDSGVGTGRQVAEQGERWRKKKGRDECASHKLPVEWTLRHAAKMWGGTLSINIEPGKRRCRRSDPSTLPFLWPLVGSLGLPTGKLPTTADEKLLNHGRWRAGFGCWSRFWL